MMRGVMMMMMMVTILLLPDLGLAVSVVQKFVREPPDQTAAEGEHVTLPCRVDNKVGPLQWTRDDFGLGLNRNLKGFERYRMSGSDEEGDYTLDIDQVTLEDDARFQCQVGAAPGVAPVRSRYARLTVTVRPEPPVILQGPGAISTQEDRVISLECVSRGGKPAAEITWLDNWNSPIKHHIETITETLPDGKRKNTRSVLKLPMKKSHHNTSLTCEALNSAESVPQSTRIQLMVEFAPSVSLERQPLVIREGDTAIFRCRAVANPQLVTYKWFLGAEEMFGSEDGSVLVLPGLNRTRDGEIVKCQVSNSIGKSEETFSLDIFYSPEFLVTPEDVSGDIGQEAVLQCVADANPGPAYKWFRNDNKEMVIGYSSNLTIFISPSTVGKYTCHVSVRGYKDVSASSHVYARGPPVIVKSPERGVQYGSLGETVQVQCESVSVPPAATVVWKYKDYPVNTRTSHYQVVTKRRGDRTVSTLVIANTVLADFGTYNCTVRNTYGHDFQLIEIVRKEDTTLLLTLVAVISGVVVIMAVLLIVLHCRRLRVRTKGLGSKVTEAAESFTDQEIWPGPGEAGECHDVTESKAAAVKESNGNGLCFPNGNHTVFQSKLGGNIPLAMCGNGNGSIMGHGQPSPDQASDVFTSYNYGGQQGSLNISNPRYSAMYRNTLLRYSPTPPDTQLPPPTPVYPGPASPMSVRSAALTSPYHTIRAQQQQQQYIQAQDGLNNGRLATHV